MLLNRRDSLRSATARAFLHTEGRLCVRAASSLAKADMKRAQSVPRSSYCPESSFALGRPGTIPMCYGTRWIPAHALHYGA